MFVFYLLWRGSQAHLPRLVSKLTTRQGIAPRDGSEEHRARNQAGKRHAAPDGKPDRRLFVEQKCPSHEADQEPGRNDAQGAVQTVEDLILEDHVPILLSFRVCVKPKRQKSTAAVIGHYLALGTGRPPQRPVPCQFTMLPCGARPLNGGAHPVRWRSDHSSTRTWIAGGYPNGGHQPLECCDAWEYGW